MPKTSKKPVKRTALAKYLHDHRLEKQVFAKMVGVQPCTVSQWLYSDAVPSYATLCRIAATLGLEFNKVAAFFTAADNVTLQQ